MCTIDLWTQLLSLVLGMAFLIGKLGWWPPLSRDLGTHYISWTWIAVEAGIRLHQWKKAHLLSACVSPYQKVCVPVDLATSKLHAADLRQVWSRV